MERRIMNLLHQCKAMIPPRNYAPWSRMVVGGGNGNWSSEKKAWYISSTSSSTDAFTKNYLFAGNWIKLEPGKYRLECSVESSDGKNVRVLIFLGVSAPVSNTVIDLRQPKVIRKDFEVSSTQPWYCMRFGSTQYNQTVYLHWCRLTKL